MPKEEDLIKVQLHVLHYFICLALVVRSINKVLLVVFKMFGYSENDIILCSIYTTDDSSCITNCKDFKLTVYNL